MTMRAAVRYDLATNAEAALTHVWMLGLQLLCMVLLLLGTNHT